VPSAAAAPVRAATLRQTLEDKVALVTGGSGGIGAGIARALAAHGARVGITANRAGRDERSRAALLAELAALTGAGRAAVVSLDVRDVDAIDRGVDDIAAQLGPIDILVNNAGTSLPQRAIDVDLATFRRVLDTNLTGLFFMSQAVARRMIDRGAPQGEWPYSIVNVSSQMGLVGAERRSVYCASKAAVVNLTRALAVEWACHGIRVNGVAPTFIHTPLADPMFEDPDFSDWVRRGSPMGQIGEPEDVAAAVCYLCGPSARLVCGHTLAVDGGWTAW
jgi:NAD(P)-dependent dehydrogenase (short-subunit alcohol dehydrogenase family)